jgi:hypothetical protein
MNDSNEKLQDSGWDRGWEEHKLRQLVRMSRLTMAQKLQWLEDMQVLYEKLSLARQKATNSKKSSARDAS